MQRKRVAAVTIKSALNLAIENSLKYKTKEKITRRLNVFIAITVFKNSFIKMTENQINTLWALPQNIPRKRKSESQFSKNSRYYLC